MTPALPPEIWVQILAFLPLASLHQIKHVNRVLYQSCKDRLFREIHLIPMFTPHNIKGQLRVLRKRLNLAEMHSTLIKSIRFMPSIKLVVPDYFPRAPAQKKPSHFLKQFFRKSAGDPMTPLEIHSASEEASDLDEGLFSLIPSLTSLDELDMEEPGALAGGWSSTAELALKTAAFRLKVLTLRFGSAAGLPNVFCSNENPVTIALPALQTFRLSLGPGSSDHFESHAQKIFSASPLLREIQYHIWGNDVRRNNGVHMMDSPTLPHLKAFKWAVSYPSIASMRLPPSFVSHSFQFHVVHLDPPPSYNVFSSLNMAQLVELRVDFHGSINVANFFAAIVGAEQLAVLEVIGFPPYDAISDPATLFPRTGLGRLRELYLGIILPVFTVESLQSLASSIPHLSKLALIVEPLLRWTRADLCDICKTLLDQFHLSTINTSFSEWKLWDFGILVQQSSLSINDIEGLSMAISREVPSIRSFYGTGSLHLWDGMENRIEESWGGELWNKKMGKW
ncbi:hypothetical protein DL96DRAFT_1687406 [Flagelloscypha sp. PMI_526]|nr:hypothetical protein DL96DRAFT_1687406 [Flagelloscypha sp. PMI_526]